MSQSPAASRSFHPTLRETTSRAERQQAWAFCTLTAVYFGIPMAIVALAESNPSAAETNAWFGSVGAGIVLLGILAGAFVRTHSDWSGVWRVTAMATAAALVGFYIPFASSNTCSAVEHVGGCAVSGLAGIVAAAVPLYLGFLGPVAVGKLLGRRFRTPR